MWHFFLLIIGIFPMAFFILLPSTATIPVIDVDPLIKPLKHASGADTEVGGDHATRDLIALWKIDMDGKVNEAVEICFGSFHRYAQYMNFSHPLIKEKFELDAWRKEKCIEAESCKLPTF
ncbi:hypothetical protein ZIOFF_000928 [Zingiber officinale]|uniref:Uncharacterized protein n=1 Tax=Zingiber officinale TaxID=94328 RepID=A0A8J5HUP9_ZINOF|nr:hypothetical protein ZIOFF_000928 [Zingiber officinale]